MSSEISIILNYMSNTEVNVYFVIYVKNKDI